MNDPPESTRGAHASVERINGHVGANELTDHRLEVRPAEILQHSIRERAHRLEMWNGMSSGQELGMERSRNDEFMTVFSHELRNSRKRLAPAVSGCGFDVGGCPGRQVPG